ncbi:hypothetical protein [Streptomyces sp. NPDC058157]|uniref:hypothetical protein n=1 Tax=Streptomyces sp. NPDC058157 TaxID=3346360 RepID=UPI0036EF3578
MTMRTMDATQELAAFLRSRREGLDPDRLGLPSRRQPRRTAGLRREEVAELAGVSTDYAPDGDSRASGEPEPAARPVDTSSDGPCAPAPP